MEHTLGSWLALRWDAIFPPVNAVSRVVIYQYLLIRSSHGATRAMVQSEISLWDQFLLELNFGRLPLEYVKLKMNEVFPLRGLAVSTPKPALAERTVIILLQRLCTALSAATDPIARTLAIRDIWLLHFGFFHLLRRSELVAVEKTHIRLGDTPHVFVPKSKTDRIGQGAAIPLITNILSVGAFALLWTDFQRARASLG